VASNNFLREQIKIFQKTWPTVCFLIPEQKYCTDNAAMIGELANTLIAKKLN
jgi:tRNA A37 threonylcarbamoyltransferase TsaD